MAFDPMSVLGNMSSGDLAKIAMPTPAGPSWASGGTLGGAMFDSSGWNVNFGSGGITSDRTQTPLPGLDSMASSIGKYAPYLALAFVGAMVWKSMRKKR